MMLAISGRCVRDLSLLVLRLLRAAKMFIDAATTQYFFERDKEFKIQLIKLIVFLVLHENVFSLDFI